MATLYNAIFEEIFKNCSSIVLHDFNQVKGITCQSNVSQFSPIVSFCMSTLQKMFDETIKVLKKTKYNGTVILPQNIYIDRQNRINLLDCIKTSHSAEKKYIIINEQNEIMLTYPKMGERKSKKDNNRIVFLPIDGVSSFAFGIQDFVIVLAQQELDDNNIYQTKYISFYNPLTKDVYNIDKDNGCSFNGKKITNDNILQVAKDLNSIFVNNYELPFSFDINKVASISNTFASSTSIFLSICNVLSTNTNLVIYKKSKDEIINTLIDFCINSSSLQSKTIGNHILIGTNKIIEHIQHQ